MLKRNSIRVNEVTLSYLEQNEKSLKVIFFVHGNSGSTGMWQKQFKDLELSSYHLIAFDLPGHGLSDGLEEEQYSVINLASLLASAMQQLSVNRQYIVVGFSLGTNICAELLAYSLHPAGMVMLGSSIIGEGIGLKDTAREGADPTPMLIDEANSSDVERFIRSSCHSRDDSNIQSIISDYWSTKPPFRSALFKSALEERFSDEIFLLKQYGRLLLVIFGDDEEMSDKHYLDGIGLPLWNDTIYRIPGGSHFINIDQPMEVNKLINEYFLDITKGTHASGHSSIIR